MLILLVLLVSIFMVSCNKEKTAQMTVKMTDAPADFLSVNVNIVAVEMMINDSWVTMRTNVGIYDLLQLQNDLTVVISPQTEIPAGKVKQMRLVLGSENSIKTDLGVFPLTVPSGSETGLKLNMNTEVVPEAEVIVVVDFDARASVVVEGNGSYSLKPHLSIESVTQL